MPEDWINVCKLNDLIPDTGACALVNREQVAIFRVTNVDQLFAVSNFDPIGQANVMSRGVIGSIGEDLVIASPLYKQHFKLATGQCIEDPEYHLKIFPVRQVEGQVQVQVNLKDRNRLISEQTSR